MFTCFVHAYLGSACLFGAYDALCMLDFKVDVALLYDGNIM